ncbi:hypothetical protein CI610_01802 [invertebrate metagenome]|uniref:TonB C-terminal domain-containing protein n=1 Tax=invertebrate metagenome TaxID=1711999 RepID=A0A2H9T7M4_9ZZZZ
MSHKLILTLLLSLSVHVTGVLYFSQQEKQIKAISTGSIQAPVKLTFSTVAVPEIPKAIKKQSRSETQPEKKLNKPLPEPQVNNQPVLKKAGHQAEKKPDKERSEDTRKQSKKKQEISEQKQSTQTVLTESKARGLSEEPVLISQPTIVNQVQPRYPSRCLRRNIEGAVNLELLVNKQGQVIDISILESSGHSQMDKSAVLAVKQWAFKPEQRDGRRVALRLHQRVIFKIH